VDLDLLFLLFSGGQLVVAGKPVELGACQRDPLRIDLDRFACTQLLPHIALAPLDEQTGPCGGESGAATHFGFKNVTIGDPVELKHFLGLGSLLDKVEPELLAGGFRVFLGS